MAKRKYKLQLADGVPRVLEIDTEATKGATLGDNLYLPDGSVATAASLAAWLNLTAAEAAAGVTKHKLLQGLGEDDHTQYTAWAQDETVTGVWTIQDDLRFEYPNATLNEGRWLHRTEDGTYTFLAESDENSPDLTSVLLVHFDGTDGSQTYTDSSISAHTISPSTYDALDTAQKKFGTASYYIPNDGHSSSYATIAPSTDFDFGSGDFTIELWMRPEAFIAGSAANTLISHDIKANLSASSGWRLQLRNSGAEIRFAYLGTSGTSYIAASYAFNIGQWYAVAVTRVGSTLRLFVDGVVVASGTVSGTGAFVEASSYLTIGAGYDQPSSHFYGWIDEVRVTKGTGRYTTTYTPATAAFTGEAESITTVPVYEVTRSGYTPILFDVQTTDFEHNGVKVIETASNLGSGSQVFSAKTNYDLAFRSLVAGSGVTVTQGANDITFALDYSVATWKKPVRVATTAAGTLASSFANGQTVDGVTLATGDRILIKNQSSGAENGIYTVNASGAPTRVASADASAELVGAVVVVSEGTVNADRIFICTNNATITVGTTALVFAELKADVANDAITFAKMQNITSGVLLGRVSASTGDVEEVTINSFTADATPDGAADYVLTWDASASAHKKVLLDNLPGGGGGGATTLDGLTDVDTTGVGDGDALVYDAGTSTWIPGAGGGGGGSVATDSIWDAKGDLAAGTGANTAAKVSVGTDGQVLVADSTQAAGVKWANANGVVGLQNDGCFLSRAGAAQTFASGSTVAVQFDTENRDDHSYSDLTTANTKITIPKTGWYVFQGSFMWSSNASGLRDLGFLVNGSGNRYGMHRAYGNGSTDTLSAATAVIYLAAGDYVELVAAQDSGSTLNGNVSSGQYPTMSCHRLGIGNSTGYPPQLGYARL